MAEVLGAVSAVNQLLETTISLVKRLRKAYDRQKDLPALFDHVLQEVSNISKLIEIVKEQDALRTENVASTLHGLMDTENRLNLWLRRVDPEKKGSLQQFARQLIHGSNDRRVLDEIRNELSRVKADLGMHIQFAHVGITRTIGKGVIANTEVVRRIDRRLVRIFGKEGGLKVAQLLRNRSPERDGSVQLSDADMASLDSGDSHSTTSSEPPVMTPPRSLTATSTGSFHPKIARTSARNSARSSPSSTARSSPIREKIVIDNTTTDLGFMLNAPIKAGAWKDCTRVEIARNNAGGSSFMINYPNAMEDIKMLAEIQDRRIEGERQMRRDAAIR